MPPEPTTTTEPDDQVARGAIAIITDSQGRLLLHLRDDIDGIAWPGYWSVLGGGCDPGEHPDQTIVRELDEEAATPSPVTPRRPAGRCRTAPGSRRQALQNSGITRGYNRYGTHVSTSKAWDPRWTPRMGHCPEPETCSMRFAPVWRAGL